MRTSASDLTGAQWRKSSRSGGQGQCVEVARGSRWAAVRDSKNVSGSVLVFGVDEWTAFLDAVKAGRLDL